MSLGEGRSSFASQATNLFSPSSTTTSTTTTTGTGTAATVLLPSTTTPTTTTTTTDFTFPPHYSFPPFFTLQPNLTTRASQLQSWSSLIQSYCRHHRLYSLLPTDFLSTPLFTNTRLNRHLSARDVHVILSWMATSDGGRRAEFADPAPASKKGEAGGQGGGKTWIYWRRPEEWADMLERWVEGTGQKGAVLTLYELTESDAVKGEGWEGMEVEMLRKSLAVLVKKGRAQVFGQGEELGVKFF